jgi:4'-phosphopantetheinyl transferase
LEVSAVRWLARGEDAFPAGLSWLTPGEAARAAGLRYTKRRTEYLLRRLAAKHAVAAALGLTGDLARIEVRNAPSGAPYVFVDGAPCGLEVSISDRAGWAVCLVGPAGPAQREDRSLRGPQSQADFAVGCDLELVEPRSSGFLRDFLTEPEQRYVAAQPDADTRDAAANLLWSAKESALKVLRTGLRRDTRSVEVTVHTVHAVHAVHRGQAGGWAPLSVRSVEGVTFPGWWRRYGQFLFTVAATGPVPPPVALEDPRALAAAVPRHSWLSRPLADQPFLAPAPRQGTGAAPAPG